MCYIWSSSCLFQDLKTHGDDLLIHQCADTVGLSAHHQVHQWSVQPLPTTFQLFPHLLHDIFLILLFLAKLTFLSVHLPFLVVWSQIQYITSLHLSKGTIQSSRYAIMHLIFCPNKIDSMIHSPHPGLHLGTVVGKYMALSPQVAWFLLIHFLPLLGQASTQWIRFLTKSNCLWCVI